ncbi:glycosyltransferase family 2 protein [Demequina sp. NBRC 110054]|uniref:glycosyltransferase family 2 protein n=1 Tax=Demequina sp. NBRC 110054 TaxID=1570343 RepID=UPI00190EACD9|nr:glycosyltransferase family 2 protein [Demequina sp. NBRC 110054]
MSIPQSPDSTRHEHHPFMGSEQSPVLITLVMIATLGVLAYAGFLLNPSNRGDIVPYVMVVTAELVLVLHALMTSWTILAGGQNPRTYAVHHARSTLYAHHHGDPTRWPIVLGGRPITVDILITVYGEPLDVIERTTRAALAMRGSHRTWILDDGRSDEVKELAATLGARYVRRLTSHGAKAGNVNHALTLAKGEFFAIFDADFVPRPEFIEHTLPFFVDRKLAFVQTPQAYGNEHDSVIAKGAAYMQTVFYRFVQPGKNKFNAAFCVGTNVMFRREAVLDVGGIYTDSKSEDVWTSIMLHERGWRSIFIPEVLAIGDAPDSVEAFSKQQLRWATGGFEILFTHPLFSRKKSNLTLDQRLQYLTTASFYLTGIAPLPLLLVPPLEIFFDLRPVSLSITVLEWALFYAGFYLMQIILAWYALGTYKWQTLTLATVSFPVYTKALFNVLRGKDVGWQSTGSVKQSSAFNFMIPQMLFFAFLLIASFVAIWRDVGNGLLTLATVWNILNTTILGVFIVSAGLDIKPRAWGRRAKSASEDPSVHVDELDVEIAAMLEEHGEIAPGAMPVGVGPRLAEHARYLRVRPEDQIPAETVVTFPAAARASLPAGGTPSWAAQGVSNAQSATAAATLAATMAARSVADTRTGHAEAARAQIVAVPDAASGSSSENEGASEDAVIVHSPTAETGPAGLGDDAPAGEDAQDVAETDGATVDDTEPDTPESVEAAAPAHAASRDEDDSAAASSGEGAAGLSAAGTSTAPLPGDPESAGPVPAGPREAPFAPAPAAAWGQPYEPGDYPLPGDFPQFEEAGYGYPAYGQPPYGQPAYPPPGYGQPGYAAAYGHSPYGPQAGYPGPQGPGQYGAYDRWQGYPPQAPPNYQGHPASQGYGGQQERPGAQAYPTQPGHAAHPGYDAPQEAPSPGQWYAGPPARESGYPPYGAPTGYDPYTGLPYPPSAPSAQAYPYQEAVGYGWQPPQAPYPPSPASPGAGAPAMQDGAASGHPGAQGPARSRQPRPPHAPSPYPTDATGRFPGAGGPTPRS